MAHPLDVCKIEKYIYVGKRFAEGRLSEWSKNLPEMGGRPEYSKIAGEGE